MATKIGPCLLIILATVWITNGFSTKKCDHNELSDQLRQFTSCLNSEFLDLVDELLKDYKGQLSANKRLSYDLKKGCPALQRHADHIEKCTVSLTSSCLDDKVTDLAKYAFEGTGIVCEILEHFFMKLMKAWGSELGAKIEHLIKVKSSTHH